MPFLGVNTTSHQPKAFVCCANNANCAQGQKSTCFFIVLAELYQLIRNPKIFGREIGANEAVDIIQQFRQNRNWTVIENAPVMDEVWNRAAQADFARRRFFDVRLALTLRHHGVTSFATANLKDYQNLGFEKVWNPLKEVL